MRPKQKVAIAVLAGFLTGSLVGVSGVYVLGTSADEGRAWYAWHEGFNAFEKGDNTAALALYNEASRLHPSWDLPLLGLGEVQLRLGNIERARELFRSACEVDANLNTGVGCLPIWDLDRRLSTKESSPEEQRLDGGARNIP